MSAPLFVTGSEHRPVLKGIGRVLIGAIVFNALSPLSVLAQDKPAPSPAAQHQIQQLTALNQQIEAARIERSRSPAERLTHDFQQAQDLVRALNADARSRTSTKLGGSDMEVRAIGPDMRIQSERSSRDKLTEERRTVSESRLREHLRTLGGGRTAARADFDQVRRDLVSKKASVEILARHDAAVRDFEQRSTQFERASQSWTDGPADAKPAALAELDDFFKRYPVSRPVAPQDPKKLPWRSPEPTKRLPAETQTAWFQNLWGTPKVTLAAAGSVGPISFDVMPEPGQLPTEADLAATPETQLTPALTAKAAELGNNPLHIHNWVRNNVEWLPTWGAVQGADDTLAKKRGNAHDIASLEIALLRAAKVPARYQYGTIEVDADKLQNWVGGVGKVEAAQQLLGQGGVANRGIVQGGGVAKVRMEHVWVSAYVNWLPSRGAKQGAAGQHVNPMGPHNAWVPLDPSYKQYTYTPGVDLNARVQVDSQALQAAAQQGATVNAQQGWVQNINRAAIQAQLTDYQTRLKAATNGQTVGGVMGRKLIPQQLPSLIAASLPFAVVQMGQLTAAVPSNLQHQFRFQLYAGLYGYVDESAPILVFQEKTSQLAGKRLTLSYVPATQADVDLIASYLPKPRADGSPLTAAEIPTSLPGYLIRLRPQIALDGRVVAQSNEVITMGTDLISDGGFTRLDDIGGWDMTRAESNVAGQATAIGLSVQGVSASQLAQLKSRLTTTASQLQANNLAGLTGEQVSGDVLSGAIWSWFAAVESHGRGSQAQAGIIDNPGLSYGLFHAVVQPIYSWGVVRQVRFPGANIDVPHARLLAVAKDGSTSDWVAYNRLRGQYMSALEHIVPERLFNDVSRCNLANDPAPRAGLPACAEGISAVKAMDLAARGGQKIYTLTPEVYAANPGIVQSQLSAHSSQTQQRVQSYLDAGFEVNIHEKPIAQSGWTGSGLIATDLATGSAAYLIEGGSNGGWFAGFASGATLGLILTAFAAAVFSGPMAIFAGLVLAFVVFSLLLPMIALMAQMYADGGDEWDACFWGGFGIGLSIGTWNLSGALAKLVQLLGLAMGIGVPSNAATQCF